MWGPDRTSRHQRVKESEVDGYIVVLETLGTPTSLSVPPLPATPPAGRGCIYMQYCSNAGAHGTIKEEASSYNGQFSTLVRVCGLIGLYTW